MADHRAARRVSERCLARGSCLALASLFVLFPWPAAATEPDDGGYPTPEGIEHIRVDTAYVLEAGEFECNLIAGHRDRDGGGEQHLVAELEYGLTDRLMLEIEVPYRFVEHGGERTGGFGDLELEVRCRLRERAANSLALKAELGGPTGDASRGLGGEGWEAELGFLATHRFAGLEAASHLELGLEWEEAEGLDRFFANLALHHYGIGDDLGLQIAVRSAFGEGPSELSVLPGFQTEWELGAREVGLGLGAELGLTDAAPDWGVRLNIELEF